MRLIRNMWPIIFCMHQQQFILFLSLFFTFILYIMYFIGTNNDYNRTTSSRESPAAGIDKSSPTNPLNFNFSYNNSSNTNSSNSTDGGSGGGGSVNNGFLIAIEVIFSVLVLFILVFCFFAGMKRKRRLRRLNENMIENAINQQERRIQLNLQGRFNSSSTVTSSIRYPPPSYSPPDPANQLSNDAVSRLDHLLLENHICTLQHDSPNTTTVALPKYSDLYQNGEHRTG